jgi:hypothetical protein
VRAGPPGKEGSRPNRAAGKGWAGRLELLGWACGEGAGLSLGFLLGLVFLFWVWAGFLFYYFFYFFSYSN